MDVYDTLLMAKRNEGITAAGIMRTELWINYTAKKGFISIFCLVFQYTFLNYDTCRSNMT